MGDGDGDGGTRLEALDGLRGVAALFVVAMHAGDLLGLVHYPRHAYLAVPFFFVLSGVVIARAYEDGLMRRGTAAAFLAVRAERLYPMLAAGLALGLAVAGARATFGHASGAGLAGFAAAALVMLPVAQAGLPAFPLLPPQWSLAVELYGNLLHRALVRRLGTRALAAALPPLFAAMALGAWRYGGLNTGWSARQLPAAAATFGFCYGAGVLLHRWRAAPAVRRCRAPGWLIVAALVASFGVPQPLRTGANAWRDAGCVLLYPPLIAAAMHLRPGRRWRAVADRLGRLSYPLYISHYPVVLAGCAVAARVAPARLALYAAVPVVTALAAAVAWALLVWWDEPVRRRLRARRDPSAGPA